MKSLIILHFSLSLSFVAKAELYGGVMTASDDGGGSQYKVGLTSEFREKGATGCDRFIQNNGEYGEYGEILYSTLMNDERIRKVLIDDDKMKIRMDPVMNKVCPGFSQLNKEDRARFWVWSMAAIAWDESKCNADIRPKPGPNDTLIGILQLEDRRSSRSWRGKLCNVPSIRSVDAQLQCALDIMRGQFECTPGAASCSSSKGTYGPASLKSSYWEKLRGNNDSSTIKVRMAKFPGCKSNLTAHASSGNMNSGAKKLGGLKKSSSKKSRGKKRRK